MTCVRNSLCDLFTIISTERASDSTTFTLLIHAINEIDASLHNRKDKSVEDVKYDHTPNWRKI